MPRFDEARTALTARVVGTHSRMSFAPFCKANMCKAFRGLSVWSNLLASLFLAVIASPIGFADTPTDRVLLPIEVLSADGTTVSRTAALKSGDAESVRSLWLQVHGVRYANEASVSTTTRSQSPNPAGASAALVVASRPLR